MPLKGLALPIQATPSGGFAVSEGDDHAEKILRVALSDCDNDNAFQQGRGIDDGYTTFGVQGAALQAKVQQRLTAIFADFEANALYKLITDTIAWETDADNQDMILSFDYTNLETDERKTLTQRFSGQGA